MLKYSNGVAEFSIPTENENKPIVTKVYPTSNQLPENLLRMYIQFSKHMKTINNLKHIKLFDAAGKEVIVDGKAFVNEVSVADLKHYAEDAGKRTCLRIR